MVKYCLLSGGFLTLLFIACLGEKKEAMSKQIVITLKQDSSAIVVKGLDAAILEELSENDSLVAAEAQSLFAVYRESDDEELLGLENPLTGTYQASTDELIFTPDTLFSKGNSYRAELRIPDYYTVQSTVRKKKLPGRMETIAKVFGF